MFIREYHNDLMQYQPIFSRMSPPPMLQTSNIKPQRMKQRSGQRAFSESEAQSFLMQQTNAVTSIVSGASITSMASTGSYTDNPGYLTLRSIHSRHRPVLDFIETGAGKCICFSSFFKQLSI